jgi:hypothetical protein
MMGQNVSFPTHSQLSLLSSQGRLVFPSSEDSSSRIGGGFRDKKDGRDGNRQTNKLGKFALRQQRARLTEPS